MRRALALIAGLCASYSAVGAAEPRRAPHEQYKIDRRHAEAAPSMKGAYIDPCDPPDQIRRFWKPLRTPALEAARLELQRYRNMMSCKSIKIYDVPGFQREADYDAAMDRGDAAAAKQIAGELHAAALALVIDRAFVERRIDAAQIYRSDPNIAAHVRPRIDAQFADVERELAAGRHGAANLILNQLLVTAISNGGARPVTSAKCRNGRDPTRGCG